MTTWTVDRSKILQPDEMRRVLDGPPPQGPPIRQYENESHCLSPVRLLWTAGQ